MGQGIPCVGNEIHQYLFDLAVVCKYVERLGTKLGFEFHIFPDQAGKELAGLFNGLVYVDVVQIGNLFAAEGEKAPGQSRGPVSGCEDL